ncbi:G-type lectin S-receptor-like serine/threonine-protein kinase [Tanacetum coccineum]
MCTSLDTIAAFRNITDGETIVSGNERFELGFFSPGSLKNRYLGIWFKNTSPVSVVWVANREIPLINNLGLVKLDSHGILFLVSSGGTVIWSSNTSASSPNVKPTAQLLDSGNLVIKTENNVLWQSFDYPGDTFIPGMKMGKNFITGKETYVTSWRSVDDPFPGFELNTPEELNSYNWTNGCRRSRALDCGPGEGFLKLASMKFPDTQNAVFDGSMILQECEVACKDNCSCTAYANPNISRDGVGCLQWFGELIDVRVYSVNGQDLYVRLADSELLSPRVTVSDAPKENRVGPAATAVYIYPMVPTYSVNNSDI